MSGRPTIRVTLVGAPSPDARLVTAILRDSVEWNFIVTDLAANENLDDAIVESAGHPGVLLYWLSSEDVDGDHRLRRATGGEPSRPVIVMMDMVDPTSLRALGRAGVRCVLPPSQWTVSALPAAIAMTAAQVEGSGFTGSDALTGLPTRGVFNDRLELLINRYMRDRAGLAVLFVDVDDFKAINDSFGHDAGDQFLREVSGRIRDAVRRNDTVARLGGDEFGVLLEGVDPPEVAMRIARKIIEMVCRPVVLANSQVPVSVSIGACVPSPDQRRMSALWVQQAADAALYAAKREGKKKVSLFTRDMDRALIDRIQMEDDLAAAVSKEEFKLHFQPVVTARAGALVGFEALLRWDSPRIGTVSPQRFVPALERIGLMPRVSEAAFAEALGVISRWRTITGSNLRVHLNLSGAQVIDQDFSSGLLAMMGATGVPPEAVVLELTESLLFRHSNVLAREFAKLHWAGVGLAIDDFGTGFNSYTYLKRFAVDMLKIDRSFVTHVATDPADAAIVGSIAHLASRLGIAVVAEGVETEAQMEALESLGQIDFVQGYLTGAPMPAADVEADCPSFVPLLSLGNEGTGPTKRTSGGAYLRQVSAADRAIERDDTPLALEA